MNNGLLRALRSLQLLLMLVMAVGSMAHADSAKLVNPSNNHAYQRFDTLLTWDAAKTACEGLGAHLATATSQTENDWISNNILDGMHPWLGGTDTTQEGTWSWITGEQWDYTSWNWGEPNGGNTDNCLHYYAPYVWNDARCGGGTPYICEWDSLTLTAGLVAHYPFNGNANDESGNGNNGTVNGATLTADRFGNANSAYNFNGENSYAAIPNIVNNWSNGSLVSWIKYNNVNPGYNGSYIFSATACSPAGAGSCSGDGMNLGIHPETGSLNLRFGIYTGTPYYWNWADSGITPIVGQWYHIVGTWGIEGTKIYVDGILLGTNFYTGPSPASNYNIIGASSWPGSPINGIIDDLRIYNRVLSDSEIQQLYTEPPATLPLTINKTGTGSGTVTSNQPGINCGDDCTESYNYGTSVTLTATPATDSNFGGWTGDADCSDGTVTMDAAKNCIATFNLRATAPTCTSNAATNVTINSATLNGNVISSSTTATASFELGPTSTYGTNLAAVPSQIYSSTPVAISATSTGLACKTTYHYRCKAINSAGTGYGADKSFTTLATCPANAWLYPTNPAVVVGKPLALDIHVNSNSNAVGAYDFTVNFDTTKLLVDVNYQNAVAQCVQGVCPGSAALASNNVLTDNATGKIRLSGFDTTGVSSGNDLQLLVMHFMAKNVTGLTPVGFVTNELTNPQGMPLGGVATGTTVKVSPGLCGDSDGNYAVNIVDALSIARRVIGYPPPPTITVNLADVNRSGTATIVDALHIARVSVGLVVTGTCAIGQPL